MPRLTPGLCTQNFNRTIPRVVCASGSKPARRSRSPHQRETENDADGECYINHRYVDLQSTKEGRDERGLNQFPTIIISTFALTTPAITLKIRGKAVAVGLTLLALPLSTTFT
jgi:hypothetical protein